MYTPKAATLGGYHADRLSTQVTSLFRKYKPRWQYIILTSTPASALGAFNMRMLQQFNVHHCILHIYHFAWWIHIRIHKQKWAKARVRVRVRGRLGFTTTCMYVCMCPRYHEHVLFIFVSSGQETRVIFTTLHMRNEMRWDEAATVIPDSPLSNRVIPAVISPSSPSQTQPSEYSKYHSTRTSQPSPNLAPHHSTKRRCPIS